MAEEHIGQGQPAPASWTKLFSGFKVALDIKKLLLAAAGIVAMSLGWWLLAALFYEPRSMPDPRDYLADAKTPEDKDRAFKAFQQARQRWNFLHKLAGRGLKKYDAGDLARSYEQYEALKKIADEHERVLLPVEVIKTAEGNVVLVIEKDRYVLSAVGKDTTGLEALVGKKFIVKDLLVRDEKLPIVIGGTQAMVDKRFEDLKKYRDGARDLPEIELAVRGADGRTRLVDAEAYKLYVTNLSTGDIKPRGLLRTLPWFEDRGPNPYLFVASQIKGEAEGKQVAASRGLAWLGVLVEPLVKMLAPIVYFFDSGASGIWNRLYLILVILWTLAVWGFFGGAITRMAAVQLARNEKISMGEALAFSRERFQSFFSAPVFPLLCLGVLTFFLIVFGLFSGLIPLLGDIFIAGLLWPIVLILGLVMAVVLVGLVGWPLMNPTISTEGSDSFDALSRSYSYVYQAPWHYLWYSAVALVYGVALVFFVGLMGSLMVFLGQWGVSQAPFLAGDDEKADRRPTYLFVHAPTSFGWRDLLLYSSPYKKETVDVLPNGSRTIRYEMNEEYMRSMSWYNYVGAFFVSIWLYLFFLLIVGFGYSYFWTASTVIYLLMRNRVDDTDIDEVHLEEEDVDQSFARDMTMPGQAPTPAATPGVTMVEPPALRSTSPPPGPASPGPASPPPSTATPAPTSATPATAGDGEGRPAGDGSQTPEP